MEVIRTGFNYRHGASFKINRPSGSGDFLLLIIRSEAFAVLNGETKLISPSSALIYKKGTPQLYGSLGDTYVNDWMHFTLSEAEEREFAALGIPFDTVIPLGEASELSGFVKSIVFELNSENMHKKASIQRYFDLILLKLSEKLSADGTEREHPHYAQLSKLRNEIQLEPQKDWSIDRICKKLMLSRSYIQHLYKLFFGTSITNDVKSGRIDRAKYLLSASNMPVSAVSDACGYESDVHFMRIFKQQTGLTPSEYRTGFRIART